MFTGDRGQPSLAQALLLTESLPLPHPGRPGTMPLVPLLWQSARPTAKANTLNHTRTAATRQVPRIPLSLAPTCRATSRSPSPAEVLRQARHGS